MARVLRTIVAGLLVSGGLAFAQEASQWTTHPAPLAKKLADETVAAQPGMLDVIFHVTPPGEKENYAVAAYTAKEQGSKSGEDDLSVITTGKPLVEVQKDGVRVGVVLPLKDLGAHTIGAIGMMYTYHAGDDPKMYLRRSEQIRNGLARRIHSRGALFHG